MIFHVSIQRCIANTIIDRLVLLSRVTRCDRRGHMTSLIHVEIGHYVRMVEEMDFFCFLQVVKGKNKITILGKIKVNE